MNNFKKIILLLVLCMGLFIIVGCEEVTDPKTDPITDPVIEDIVVTSLTVGILNYDNELIVGEEKTLDVTVSPENATNKEVTYKSSDENIATVDALGKVKAIKAGTVEITVKSVNNVECKISLTIKEKEIIPEPIKAKLTVKKTDYNLYVNDEENIEAIIEDNTDYKVTYDNLNEEVVSVDTNGKIKALKVGEAKINVEIKELNQKIEVKVEVKETIVEIIGEVNVKINNTLELKAKVNGVETKEVTWQTSEPKIATIENGIVTGITEGTVTITVISNNQTRKEVIITVESNEIKPTEIEVKAIYDGNLYLDTEIQLKVEVTPANAINTVTWKTSSERTTEISELGVPTFSQGGSVTFTAVSTVDSRIKGSITIDMPNYIDPIKFIKSINNPNPVQEIIDVYGMQGDPITKIGPKMKLTGAISYFLFEDLVINTDYIIEEGSPNRPGTIRTKTYYITVHSVGSYSDTSVALGTARQNYSETDASWHFSTGNDGIFQGLPLYEVGWHAGDGTGTKLVFTDTGVKATGKEPATVTISADGYFEMNGTKTTISVPRKSNGEIPTNSDLPYTGINNYIGANGNYYIGNTWWSNTYQTLSNRGGNNNSVGIETNVNITSNLNYTWQKTAKLIGWLLRTMSLDTNAVKQHNTFSGKDCPMTMRHANKWEYFMQFVEAEYKASKYLQGFSLELICDSPFVDKTGTIIKYPNVETVVNYKIRIYNQKVGIDVTEELSTTLPANIPFELVY